MGRTRVSGPVTHPGADHAGAGLERRGQHRSVATMGPAASGVSPAVSSAPRGLDVSGYQPNINWSSVKANGAKFAYMKATEGTGYTSGSFAAQYNGSYTSGLIRGAYHFALPDRSSGAWQADYFINHGGGWSADGKTLPGALDIEYNPYGGVCYGKSYSGMVTWVRSFVNEYHTRTSRWPAIYSTADWWRTCTGNSGAFGAYDPLWIACYCAGVGSLPAGWHTHSIWQYANSGTFPGDQDVFNGTSVGLARLALGSGANPAAVVGTAGTVRVYARGTTRSAYEDRLPVGGQWTGLHSLGGTWPANLTALASSGGPVYVFAVGSAGGLNYNVLSGTSWSGWKSLGAPSGGLQGRPAVVQDHRGAIRVFVRGANRSLYQAQLPPGGHWSGLWKMGGRFPDNPGALVGSSGYVWVFDVGTGGVLYERHLVPGGSWSGWVRVGGGVTGAPAATQDHGGTLRVYLHGTTSGLFEFRRPPAHGWSRATSLGGKFPDSPAALTGASGYVWVFDVGTNGVLYERHLAPGGSWSGWVRVGGSLVGVPAATQDHSGTLRVYLRGTNAALYEFRRPVGSLWSAPTSLGGKLF